MSQLWGVGAGEAASIECGRFRCSSLVTTDGATSREVPPTVCVGWGGGGGGSLARLWFVWQAVLTFSQLATIVSNLMLLALICSIRY